MTATQIVFFMAEIAVGNVFMWNEPGNNTFVVLSIVEEPGAGFAGNKLQPYAWVRWSDEDHNTTINLKSIETYVRQGLLIPEG
jgi:hypothetical protein